MNHAELTSALKSLERELPALHASCADEFRPAFEDRISHLSAQAEDPDDAVYVIERADTMLGDLGYD